MPARSASFCALALGDIGITFVPDGTLCSTPATSFPGSPEQLWADNPHLLDEGGRVVMSLGALLVRTAGRLVLVDLAWGPSATHLGPSPEAATGFIEGGGLLANLARLGVSPDEVDAVVFSHLHRDHTGWIVDPAGPDEHGRPRPTFPNAEHFLSEAEWSYWTTTDAGVGPAPSPDQLAVLEQRCSFLGDGDAPVPGLEVVATPGHTPGHLSFVLSSGDERAIVLGDAVHCPIELLEPELSFIVDVDPALARRTKEHLARELLEPGTLAAGPHFPDLVFGRLLPGEGRPSWSFSTTQAISPGPEGRPGDESQATGSARP